MFSHGNVECCTRVCIFLRYGIWCQKSKILVRASLTSLDVTYNELGEEGRAMVSDAVEGRDGFTLKL